MCFIVEANQEVNLLNYIPGDVRDKAMKYLFSFPLMVIGRFRVLLLMQLVLQLAIWCDLYNEMDVLLFD